MRNNKMVISSPNLRGCYLVIDNQNKEKRHLPSCTKYLQVNNYCFYLFLTHLNCHSIAYQTLLEHSTMV